MAQEVNVESVHVKATAARAVSTAVLLMRNPRLAAAACYNTIGAFLFGLDNSYIGPLEEMPSFQRVFNDGHALDPFQAGITTGIFSISAFVVSFPPITASVLDRFGRRRGIAFGGVLCLLGITVQALSRSLPLFWVGRAVAGCAIGVLTCVVPLYNGELASAELRGALIGMFQIGVNAGMFVAALFADAVKDLAHGWALSIWVQGLFAATLVVGSLAMPESPRWLMMESRPAAARHALARMRRDRSAAHVERELDEIRTACEVERSERARFRWATFCSGYSLKIILVGVTIQWLQQFTGVLVFVWWSVKIFSIVSLATGVSAFRLNTIQNLLNLLATVPGLFLVDRVGRRPLLFVSSCGCLVANLTAMVVGLMAVPPACAKHPDAEVCAGTPAAAGWAIVLSVYAFWIFFAFGWGLTAWAVVGEMFPQAYRSTALAFCVQTNQGCNFLIAFFMPKLLASTGFASFAIFVVSCCACAAFSVWLPETSGVPLERVTALFESKLGQRRSDAAVGDTPRGCSTNGSSSAALELPSRSSTKPRGGHWRELVT